MREDYTGCAVAVAYPSGRGSEEHGYHASPLATPPVAARQLQREVALGRLN